MRERTIAYAKEIPQLVYRGTTLIRTPPPPLGPPYGPRHSPTVGS